MARLKLHDANPEFLNYGQSQKPISMKEAFPDVYKSWSPERKKIHDSGFAFLQSNLALVDKTVYKPFYNVTYDRDVKKIEVGSEMIDTIEFYKLDYKGIEDTINNIFGTKADLIPVVTGGLLQDRLSVFNFEVMHEVKFLEMERLAKKNLPVSIEEVYKETILIGFDLFTNNVFYTGIGTVGGLFNLPGAMVNTIPTITSTNISDSGTVPDTMIYALFNGMIKAVLDASNNNLDLMPNRFLVPNFVGRVLTDRASVMLQDNLRGFILKHNLASDEAIAAGMKDFQIAIESRAQLDNMGIANKGRIVAYNDSEMFLKFRIPFGLKAYMTLPNINTASYQTLWVAQVAQLQTPYTNDNTQVSPIMYWDFSA